MTQKAMGEPSTPTGSTMSAKQVKALWYAVVIMGILLIVGFFVVVGKIIYEVRKLGEEPSALASQQESVLSPPGGLRKRIGVPLPAGSVIKASSLSGNRMTLHSASPAGEQITVIDLVSGTVLSRVTVSSEQ